MALSIAGILERNFNEENDTTLLWIAFVVVNIADAISTAINVGIYGPMVEMNPMIRPLIEQHGASIVFLWKIAWAAPLFALGQAFLKYRAVLLLNVVLLSIVYGNVFLH